MNGIDNWKYPRTYHLPFSPGLTNDDRKVEEGWETLLNETIVITEKLDGEGNSLSNQDVYARSHGAPTRSPWSRNLWDVGGVHSQIKRFLADDEMIFGENLYGIHSIEYDKLTDYYHLFAVRNEKEWYSWDEVKEMASIMGIPHVPELEIKKFNSVDELKERILYWMSQGSRYGDTIEGIVVRNINSFPLEDFSRNVVKYVRPHHVQTDQFWAKNWKKASINF